MKNPIFSVRNLEVRSTQTGHLILNDVSLDVGRGEVVALIGESGSGKTTLSLLALGHLRQGLLATKGTVFFDNMNLLHRNERELRSIRGKRVSYVAQSAASAFNPALWLDTQVTESSRVHNARSAFDSYAHAHELYVMLGLPTPESIGQRYPYEVSGGQLQRIMAAMAMMEGPDLIVFDEPTTALDVTTQVEVLRAFKSVIKRHGAAAIYVSHDLSVVAQMADRVTVLRAGVIVEEGPTSRILEKPKAPYTKQLITACHRWDKYALADRSVAQISTTPIFEVNNVTAGFGPISSDGKPAFTAVDNVSLTVFAGKVIGIIGESGSGKSTLAKIITGLHLPTLGSIVLAGQQLQGGVRHRTREQQRQIQMVFQMADTALNPRHTVGTTLGRVLRYYFKLKAEEMQPRISELLASVDLSPEVARRYPSELSGGQKQRVNLARALAAQPLVLVCDEITSALDSVVAQTVLELIKMLRQKMKLGVVFITHDIATVATIADTLVVMKNGKIVESGDTAQILSGPSNAYTRKLIESVPELRVGWLEDAADLGSDFTSALWPAAGFSDTKLS